MIPTCRVLIPAEKTEANKRASFFESFGPILKFLRLLDPDDKILYVKMLTQSIVEYFLKHLFVFRLYQYKSLARQNPHKANAELLQQFEKIDGLAKYVIIRFESFNLFLID